MTNHFLAWEPHWEEQPNGSERRNVVQAFCAESAAEAYAERVYEWSDGDVMTSILENGIEIAVKAPTGEVTRWRVAAELRPSFAAVALPTCRDCGCTEDDACEGGCSWAESDLCSRCAEKWEEAEQ